MVNLGLKVDKVSHFGTCVLYTQIMAMICTFSFVETLIGIATISMVKEAIDVLCGGKFDPWDVVANYAGCFAYWVVVFISYKMYY